MMLGTVAVLSDQEPAEGPALWLPAEGGGFYLHVVITPKRQLGFLNA